MAQCHLSWTDPQRMTTCSRQRSQPVRCSSHGSSQQTEHSPPSSTSSRRSLLAAPALLAALAATPPHLAAGAEPFPTLDTPAVTEITDRVYLVIGLCPSAVRTGADRRVGDASILCADPQPLGRIVIALYGRAAPGTVANFLECVKSGAYTGSQFNRIRRGEFVAAGQQGSKRLGFVQPPPELARNPDLVSAQAFRLLHTRPGTVSLNLSENNDDEDVRLAPGYRNTSFLITTGPGPATFLDGENIVFGQVEQGLDVVAEIANVPAFRPLNDNLRAFNELGRLIGDQRASKTAAQWGRPLKAVVITDAGVL